MHFKKKILLFSLFLLSVPLLFMLDTYHEDISEPFNDTKVIKVEDFGAKGDGEKDDTESIQKAIEYLKDKEGTLLFDSNKKYRITSPLFIQSNITITSTGESKPIIFMDNSEGNLPAIYFKGRKIDDTSLKNTAKIGDQKLSLKGNTHVNENDLILIESNTPWYYDPRTGTENLHKGELHRTIGSNNSNLILENTLWDSYNVKFEDVSVRVIKPIKIKIDNIAIERNNSINRTIGVKAEYCNECELSNLTINNSVSIGIQIVSSYNTIVENSVIRGANDTNSGYGIQSYGSSFSMIRNNIIKESRRGIDISGSYADNHSIVEYNKVYGGGKNKSGLNYITEDTQYGVGSHSTANGTVFRGNKLFNLNYGINIRSKNASIIQNKFIGLMKGSCILLAYGENVKIYNNSTVPVTKKNFIGEFPNSNNNNYTANTFIKLKETFVLNRGEISILNNKPININENFINVLKDSSVNKTFINKLVIKGNRVEFLKSNKYSYFAYSEFPLKIITYLRKKNFINFDSKPQKYSNYYNLTFK
jgi:polygalacturonase